MVGGALVFAAKVCNEENDCEQNAEAADDQVAVREEDILATQHIGSRKYESLGTTESTHFVVIVYLDLILARFQIRVDHAIEFAEVRETSCAHPDNKVGVCDINPLLGLPVSCLVLKLVFHVRLPGNVVRVDRNLFAA